MDWSYDYYHRLSGAAKKVKGTSVQEGGGIIWQDRENDGGCWAETVQSARDILKGSGRAGQGRQLPASRNTLHEEGTSRWPRRSGRSGLRGRRRPSQTVTAGTLKGGGGHASRPSTPPRPSKGRDPGRRAESRTMEWNRGQGGGWGWSLVTDGAGGMDLIRGGA